MPVPKNQQIQSSLPAQKGNPKNQGIKAAAKTNPAKNAKETTVARAIVNIALAGVALQQIL